MDTIVLNFFLYSYSSGLSLAILLAAINFYNSLRNRNNLHRAALLPPQSAPWMHLWLYGDDESFLNLTGFSRRAFNLLLNDLFPPVVPLPRRKRGRPTLLDNPGQLGLFLYYVNSKMEEKHLAVIFGVTPSTVSRYIDKIRRLVIRRLKRNPRSRIQWPSREAMHNHLSTKSLLLSIFTNFALIKAFPVVELYTINSLDPCLVSKNVNWLPTCAS